jgi:hypothetical protein
LKDTIIGTQKQRFESFPEPYAENYPAALPGVTSAALSLPHGVNISLRHPG